MPRKYAIELICDYLGAAKAYWGNYFTYKGELDWWNKKLSEKPPKMHPETIEFITNVLNHFVWCEKHKKDPFKFLNIEFCEY